MAGETGSATKTLPSGVVPSPSRRLRGRPQTVRGAVTWSLSFGFGRQALQFCTLLVLARLVAPEQAGLATLALTISAFGQLFADLGVKAAVVREPQANHSFLTTALCLNIASGIALTAVFWLSAGYIASAFDQPQSAGLIRLAACSFVLSAGLVPLALLERAMHFKALAVIETSALIVGSVVSIAFALGGGGAAALVLGPVATTGASTLLLALASRWRPSAPPSVYDLRRLWRLSWGLVGFNTLNFFSRNADNLLVARALGAVELGYYGRAYSLMMLPVQQVGTTVSRVLLPVLAHDDKRSDAVGPTYVRAVKAAWVIGMPMGLGLAVTSPALVEALLGARWLPAAPVLAVLALSVPAQLIGRTLGPIYQMADATRRLFQLGLITVPLSLVAMGAGLTQGLNGLAVAVSGVMYVTVLIGLPPALRIVGVSLRELLAPLRRPAVAGVLMALGAFATGQLVAGEAALTVLALQVVAGVTCYVTGLAVFDRPALAMITGRRGRAQ